MTRKSKRRKKKRASKVVKSQHLKNELVPLVIIPDDPRSNLPIINSSKIYQMFLQGETNLVCETIIKVLNFFEINNYRSFNVEAMQHINDFIGIVFALMVNPNFKIPNEYCLQLIARSHIFANLVRISAYDSTDSILTHILNQQNNYAKMLFLYTSLCKSHLPVDKLFDLDSLLASMWYFTYPIPSIGQVTPIIHKNVERHIADIDDRYRLVDHRITPLYFACTYVNNKDGADRRVKEILNRECRKLTANVKVINKPARDSICLITAKWFPNSAVHKSCSPYIERLHKRYRLTLAHVGRTRPDNLILEPFEKVHHLQFDRHSVLNTDLIEENDFQLVYFPDIGMNDESIWLSNIRFAPIQVTSYGHPVSTFGGKIDYFIGGEESEIVEDAEKNYSERLVLIPGVGQHPSWPNYEVKFLKKEREEIIINCTWGPDKYNWVMMQTLVKIAQQAKTPFEFQFFCSKGVNRYQAMLPFVADVKSILGKYVTVHTDKEYFDYMKEAEYGDFALNSWPFGGYNTVVEALYLGKPMITMEGDKMYNRAGAALLRKVGLDDLIVHSLDDFAELTVRMIDDENFRKEKREHLRNIDLHAVLFNTDEPVYFEKAIEYLIDNHERLKAEGSREPIIIGRDV
jgi:hypothetical protein